MSRRTIFRKIGIVASSKSWFDPAASERSDPAIPSARPFGRMDRRLNQLRLRRNQVSFPSWMISGDIVVTRDEIRETLLELFEAETGEPLDALSDDQHLAEQLGLDSVDMVSLIMQLERHFKIRLTHEELADAVYVGQLLDIVMQKANEPKEASGSDTAEPRKMAA